jgi:hypothetical protein
VPLQKLQFRPGINREGTTLSNEGGWFDGDKIRFRSGYPEKIGGWAVVSYNTFLGVCRSLWNWITLKGYNLVGVGTNLKFYIESGGDYYDITPIREINGNTPSAGPPVINASTITLTANGTVLTVSDSAAESLQVDDFVTIAGANTIGGVDVNGEYQIATVTSSTSYTVTLATSTTGTASNSAITLTYQINTGYPIYTVGTGWGAGPWSPYLSATLTNPFATTNTSSTITVTQASHGLTTGQSVYFLSISDTSVGGIPNAVLQKAFTVTVVNANTYTISAVIGQAPGPVTTYTANATSASEGGTVVVYYPSSGIAASATRGWGSGFTTGIGLQLRLWSQSNFGERLLFSPRGGALYVWDPLTGATPAYSTRGTLVSGPDVPSLINEIMVSDSTRIVIAFGCNDYGAYGTTAQDPMLIRWTAQESYTDWTPSAINQAGSYRVSHGSSIIGALQTRQEIVVWTDAAIYSMQYLGPPYVWGFTLLSDNISIASPNAMATAAGVTYWMGIDKFYVYSGRVETLPCAVRTYIYGDINREQFAQIYAGTNEGFSEVWWFYCSANSNTIDRYVIFNYLDRVWYYGTMNRTAWLDSALLPYPLAANGVQGSTLSALAESADTSLAVVNSTSYPTAGVVLIGSEQISYSGNNGTSLTGCIRGINGTTAASHAAGSAVNAVGQNLLIYHEASVDDNLTRVAAPINSYVQSSDFDIGDGHNYGFVWRVIPDITFDGSNTSGSNLDRPEVNFVVRPRQNPGSAYGVSNQPMVQSADSYKTQTTYNVQQFTEIVYTRVRGRQMAFKVESSTLGTQWQLGVPRIDVRPDGRR